MKPRNTAVAIRHPPSAVVGMCIVEMAIEQTPAEHQAARRQHEPCEDPGVDERHAQHGPVDRCYPRQQADDAEIGNADPDEKLEHFVSLDCGSLMDFFWKQSFECGARAVTFATNESSIARHIQG